MLTSRGEGIALSKGLMPEDRTTESVPDRTYGSHGNLGAKMQDMMPIQSPGRITGYKQRSDLGSLCICGKLARDSGDLGPDPANRLPGLPCACCTCQDATFPAFHLVPRPFLASMLLT